MHSHTCYLPAQLRARRQSVFGMWRLLPDKSRSMYSRCQPAENGRCQMEEVASRAGAPTAKSCSTSRRTIHGWRWTSLLPAEPFNLEFRSRCFERRFWVALAAGPTGMALGYISRWQAFPDQHCTGRSGNVARSGATGDACRPFGAVRVIFEKPRCYSNRAASRRSYGLDTHPSLTQSFSDDRHDHWRRFVFAFPHRRRATI